LEKFGPVRVGLLGIGTIGRGTFEVLARNREEITRRAGRSIAITRVADLDVERAREIVGDQARVCADAAEIVSDPDIDVVIELIGGYTVAKDLVLAAIANGKHVVTANKAMLAVHGNRIFAEASKQGVMVAFEAAVAGGIPIIKAIREGLAANRIQRVAGIINGTTNFVLSEMRDKGIGFEEALAQAQALGYAEADPTFDVEGVDAAHKITLLASLAFGVPIQYDKCHVEGISKLNNCDVRYAGQLGYRIKLLGIATRRDPQEGGPAGIELRVHPTLVPERRLLANVEGAMNAVWVRGDAVGDTIYYGQGAGAEPTASAVIADLVDVARMITVDPYNRVPHLAFQPDALADVPILPIEQARSAAYLRIRVADQPGVLARITGHLADAGISIDAALQKLSEDDGQTDVILLTHVSEESRIVSAIEAIQAMPTVLGEVVRIRREELD
jgi:homoserine dehydrogenase